MKMNCKLIIKTRKVLTFKRRKTIFEREKSVY
jgi:hypothetical protein